MKFQAAPSSRILRVCGAYLGFRAAHHTRDRQGAGRIADQHGEIVQCGGRHHPGLSGARRFLRGG